MSKALEFFVWVIIGGFMALFYAFRDMWRSRKGEDIVSVAKRQLQKDSKY